MDILTRFLDHARQRPEQPFLLFPDQPAQSYAATAQRVAHMAATLQSLGLRPGDRVAVQAAKQPDILHLYLACLQTGIVFLPLNPAYTLPETDYFLVDSDAALFLCDPPRLAELHASGHPVRAMALAEGFSSLAAKSLRPPAQYDPKPEDLAAILYTSGTTGRSKGVMLTRRNLASNAMALVDVWAITGTDIVLHALPIFHTHGLFVATNTALLAGAALYFLPDFKTASTLAALPQCSVMMGVPTFYTRLLADPGLTAQACTGLRLFISGSAPLSATTHAEWQARTGHAILERYGMTETNMLTSNPLIGTRRAGTVGMALPGVGLRIADPATGRLLRQGETGGIEVTGPNVFAAYWKAPEKTAAEFRADGWFITGDMGYFDAEGYLHIVGRAKDLVITGGLNVYPAEVEAALDALPGVAASAVIGVPHPDFGEAVVALVLAREGATLEPAAIRTALRASLAAFKLPKAVMVEAEFPRNAMGKVQKNLLRDRYKGLFAGH